MSLREAVFVFSLFWAQFILGGIVPESLHGVERIGVGIVYLLLAVWVLATGKLDFRKIAHDAFRAPYEELSE